MCGAKRSSGALARAVAAVWLPLFAVAGCDGRHAAQSAADDYVERVERVLRTPYVPAGALEVPRWPRKRELLLPVEPLKIDLLDFLALHRCDLGAVVGARNNPLGRVMAASQQLLYEIRLVERLEACLRDGTLIDDAGSQAHAWLRHKRAQLPAVFWNAVVAGPELQSAFSADTDAVGPGDIERLAGIGALADALEELAAIRVQLAAEPLVVVPRQVAAAIEALRGSAAGALLRTVAVQSDALARAAAALHSVDAGAVRHPCPLGRRTPRGDILGRVFHAVYGERFQPWLARTHRQAERLNRALAALAETTRNEQTDAFAHWQRALVDPDDGLLGSFLTRIRRHTSAWRSVLTECGMLPGS